MNRSYDDIENAEPYGRLSDEDRDKGGSTFESNSIGSQRDLILQYCKEKNIKTRNDGYFDDGITGQTFDREEFQRLIRDIEKGLVDCVITKDLSRLGRDHSETGYYIEKYFPEHNVRYISINDNWDSKYDSVDMILWKLAYNDVYCADISRKIKTVLNSKKKDGKWVSSFAPYGYMKDPNNKHHLIIDPETASIVKKIFDMAYSGQGTCAIAKYLTNEGVLTPGEKCGRHPKKTNEIFGKSGHIWTTGHVRRILSHEVYIGTTAQCKIKKASYKSKKLVRNKKEDWIIVENTHEPIVDKKVYDKVQELLEKNSKKYTRIPGELSLFSKKLFCKDCGHRISLSWKSAKYHEKGKCGVCNYYKKYSKYEVCTPHYIDYDEFESQMLDYIIKVVKKRLEVLDTPRLIKENYKNLANKRIEKGKQLERLKKDLDKTENMLVKIYEDKLSDKITESTYDILSKKKELEIEEFKDNITKCKLELEEVQSQINNNEDNMSKEKKILEKFVNSKIITQDLLNLMIDKIYIGENDCVDVEFTIKSLNEIKI